MSLKTFSGCRWINFSLGRSRAPRTTHLSWSVILNGWAVPMWVSSIAFVVAAYLAFEGLRRRL